MDLCPPGFRGSPFPQIPSPLYLTLRLATGASWFLGPRRFSGSPLSECLLLLLPRLPSSGWPFHRFFNAYVLRGHRYPSCFPFGPGGYTSRFSTSPDFCVSIRYASCWWLAPVLLGTPQPAPPVAGFLFRPLPLTPEATRLILWSLFSLAFSRMSAGPVPVHAQCFLVLFRFAHFTDILDPFADSYFYGQFWPFPAPTLFLCRRRCVAGSAAAGGPLRPCCELPAVASLRPFSLVAPVLLQGSHGTPANAFHIAALLHAPSPPSRSSFSLPQWRSPDHGDPDAYSTRLAGSLLGVARIGS